MGWDANSWSGHWIPTSIRSFSARRYSPIGDEQQLRNRLKAWRWYCLTAGVVLCSAGVWASRALPEQSGASTSSTSLGRTGLVDVRLRVFNSYTKDNPIEKYPFEYIAEPYRSTILEIESWTGLDDNVEYRCGFTFLTGASLAVFVSKGIETYYSGALGSALDSLTRHGKQSVDIPSMLHGMT